MEQRKIAIVGFGLGGATFARAITLECQKSKITPPRIYILEKTKSVDQLDYTANYSISIRGDSGGLQVLEEIGALASSLNHRADSNHFYFATSLSPPGKVTEIGRVNVSLNTAFRSGIRLKRVDLQKELINLVQILPNVTIVWDAPCTGYELHADKQHIRPILEHNVAGLSDGEWFDLMIAADGAASPIRKKILPDKRLRFSGLNVLLGNSEVSDEFLEKVPDVIRNGHGMVFNVGACVWLAQEDRNKYMWGLSTYNETPIDRNDPKNTYGDLLQKRALALAEPYGEFVLELVRLGRPIREISCFDLDPISTKLTRDSKIVLIGDASHAVTPFSGNGANMALRDGVSLASKLIPWLASKSSLDECLDQFDSEMVPRARAVMMLGRKNIHMMLANTKIGMICRDWTTLALTTAISCWIQHRTTIQVACASALVAFVSGISFFIYTRYL